MKVNVHDNKLVVGNTVIEFSNHTEALNAIAVWLEIWEGEQKQLPKVAANSDSITLPKAMPMHEAVALAANKIIQAAKSNMPGRVNNGQ